MLGCLILQKAWHKLLTNIADSEEHVRGNMAPTFPTATAHKKICSCHDASLRFSVGIQSLCKLGKSAGWPLGNSGTGCFQHIADDGQLSLATVPN